MPRLDFIEMTDYHHGKYLAIASETHQYAETKAITSKRKLNWDKIDLQLYKEKTAMQLTSLLDHGGVELPQRYSLTGSMTSSLPVQMKVDQHPGKARTDKTSTHGLHISSHISKKSKPCSTNGSNKVSKRMTPLPLKLITRRSTSDPCNGKWQPKTRSHFSRK